MWPEYQNELATLVAVLLVVLAGIGAYSAHLYYTEVARLACSWERKADYAMSERWRNLCADNARAWRSLLPTIVQPYYLSRADEVMYE